MSLLTKLKEMVVEDDATPLAVTPVTTPSSPVPASILSTQSTESSTAAPSTDAVDALRAKVNPTTGPLVSFMTMLESVAEYIPDEGQRYHAAEKAIGKQQTNIASVLADITACTGKLDEEITAFEAARQRKVAQEVTQRETSLTDITSQIQSHEAAIKDLTGKRDELAIALTTAKAKIAQVGEEFQGTVRAVRSQYGDMTRKINMYLGGSK